ncbi:MAG: Holliday junction branch migration protein RuvA [Roseiflexus sp.]|nr:Holliday junction branch migration protein RuvA [Roseiflexus sp.]MCS7289444.1 Holliday junction branch migration protein RuvA [Roseiflexus sp.]MDW8144910.1 Holliday junction branch migration protein RuvA [Roseiflexaceae bacterium]MDW8233658.1 Holliday junction branch migration protein RuvA [Roseiflexaceae bacterium]
MIASVRGTLMTIAADHAVIETGGIGWMIYAPRQVLAALGDIGTEVRLFTYLLVREDALTLYGFESVEQRQLFETLLSVTGVGPQAALNLLSSGTTDEIRLAIATGDVARLARAPRIGKKLAERLVLELKGKLDIKGLPTAPGVSPAVAAANAELSEMLVSLGFSSAEAAKAIAALPPDAPLDLEERLRLALRYFGAQ